MSKIKKGINLLKNSMKDPRQFMGAAKYIAKYLLTDARDNLSRGPLCDQAREEVLREEAQVIDGEVTFSVIMPVYKVKVCWLEEAVESVRSQTYRNWELCIADDCSGSKALKDFLKGLEDERIKIRYLEKNGGISEASNQAAALATGDYIVLMDHDDVISPNALAEFYFEIQKNQPDIIYSDQDIIDENNKRSNPLLKPDWSPDLLLSQMYAGHLLGFKRELFLAAGGFRSEYNGAQDYDLLLRMTEQDVRVSHVAKILYSWRSLPESTAENPNAKPYAQTVGLKALQDHLDRTLGEGQAKAMETEYLFVYDVRYTIAGNPPEDKSQIFPEDKSQIFTEDKSQIFTEDKSQIFPLVSIIMPTKDHIELVNQAVTSILEKTEYPNYEILILNNNSVEPSTIEGLAELSGRHENVRTIDALFPFNWSRLNNFGMEHAGGDVFVFLNNDIKVIEGQWLQRIVEQALRPEIGVVGGLLLYGNGTIQHAGVIVGMGGWADHVFQGMKPIHFGAPYISPMVTRNVMAVTGACMGISKKRIEEIGGFDETFIICGSDVELCIRAYEKGYVNIYSPYIRMYHYESKTRDDYIPAVDRDCSYRVYRRYLKSGDPFYNIQLDLFSKAPKVADIEPKVKQRMEKMAEKRVGGKYIPAELRIGEINPYRLRKIQYPRKRLNLLVPSVNSMHVFGGISTALKFFEALSASCGYDRRIIVVDAQPEADGIKANANGYVLTEAEENSLEPSQIVPYCMRGGRSIPISEQDYFVFTGWWTAHCMQEAYEELEEETGIRPNLFLYLIQDYEPGFYAWSSRYLLADATYRHPYPAVAIFNSGLLKEHFDRNGYVFPHSFVFEPVLNETLKGYLRNLPETVKKKKQILIYGRPGTQRNAFELILAALLKWILMYPGAPEWKIVSAGEMHKDIPLCRNMKVVFLGKLSLEDYAKVLEESYAGISLMVSPHPSYPPLEMSVFGVKVITNTFLNKDLARFHKNITSVSQASPNGIARCLDDICCGYREEVKMEYTQMPYTENTEVFRFTDEIAKILDE